MKKSKKSASSKPKAAAAPVMFRLNPGTVTKMLQDLKQDGTAGHSANRLVNVYWRLARMWAGIMIKPSLRYAADPSQVANDAIMSSLTRAVNRDFGSRQEFEMTIYQIVRNKSISAVRQVRRKKRSAERTESLENEPTHIGTDPQEAAILNELFGKTIRYLEENKPEPKRSIIILGFFLGLPAKEVREILLRDHIDDTGLSLSNIRITINRFIEEIRQEFSKESNY